MIAPVITAVLVLGCLAGIAHKWELKTRHYLPWSTLMGLLAGAAIYGLAGMLPQVPAVLFAVPLLAIAAVASVGAILFFFFRDPERTPPQRADQIVSPADGTVVYVHKIQDGRFPFAVKNNNRIPLLEFAQADLVPDQGVQIGIAMNYLNVHVNRSPIAGAVRMVKAVPGKFQSLKHIHSLLENERALLVFENEHLKVGIVQIASRLVRRIVSYVEEGQILAQGDRVGMIKFGSQVDVLVEHRTDLNIQVQVGDEVTAGESVLMTFDPAASQDSAKQVESVQAAANAS